MLNTDNTSELLYRYLRILQIKISKLTLYRLLGNSLANIRGISDTLDILKVKNAVYQLPKEYFNQLESPFIALINDNDNPLCIVEQIEEQLLTISLPGEHLIRVTKKQFLQKWTGAVLIAETTRDTVRENDYRIKNTVHRILKHSLFIAGIISVILYVLSAGYPIELLLYFITLATGIFLSSAIIYKENINHRFLNRFCQIGKVIDCNEVLTSKGSGIVGIGLGEMSLFYFTSVLLFVLIRPADFYGIAICINFVATLFTVYSIIYQLFILRMGCMLCMLVNMTIWSSNLLLYAMRNQFNIGFTVQTICCFAAVGCICFAGWVQIRKLLKANKEKEQLKERLSTILHFDSFEKLLLLNPKIQMPVRDITLHNKMSSGNQLMVVTNLNCRYCAEIHPTIKELSTHMSVSLIIQCFPNDEIGKKVANLIISVYLADGWEKFLSVLGKWHKTHNLKLIEKYNMTEEAEKLWEQQQIYCWKQGIKKTPSFIVNGHYIPDVYLISEMKYVII